MKLFQRTAKDGNELGDLLEPEKKPRKAASERADGKDLLPGIGASLLGVAAAGALLWFDQRAQPCQGSAGGAGGGGGGESASSRGAGIGRSVVPEHRHSGYRHSR
ncbi:hypothetical protein Z046_02085 [Pseudomonas aeruginosa VRFPA09]|nr:hypothetical protein Z046_02085 [Pseudomonas aeruginosa VRFPA09]